MRLKLISIFPDDSLPVPAYTNPTVSPTLVSSFCVTVTHTGSSRAQPHPPVLFTCPLFPPLTPHSHQPLLSLSHRLPLRLHPFSVVETFLPSWLHQVQAYGGFRTGTRVAVAVRGSPVGWGTQSGNRKEQDLVVKRARISTQTGRRGRT